jgi:hypothetical protein
MLIAVIGGFAYLRRAGGAAPPKSPARPEPESATTPPTEAPVVATTAPAAATTVAAAPTTATAEPRVATAEPATAAPAATTAPTDPIATAPPAPTTSPRPATSPPKAAPKLQLTGLWTGWEQEQGRRREITVTIEGGRGTLVYSGSIVMGVPLLQVSEPHAGSVYFRALGGSGMRHYQGRWDGHTIRGTVEQDGASGGGRSQVGVFELSQ